MNEDILNAESTLLRQPSKGLEASVSGANNMTRFPNTFSSLCASSTQSERNLQKFTKRKLKKNVLDQKRRFLK